MEMVQGTGLVFAVRKPAVHIALDEWSAKNFFSGALIESERMLKALRKMLSDGEIWCLFESEALTIHCGEDNEIYLGLDGSLPAGLKLMNASVRQVHGSPYSGDSPGGTILAPVSDQFWKSILALVEAEGEVIVVCYWAGGFAGEVSFLVNGVDDLLTVQRHLVPRTNIVAYSTSHYTTIQGRGRTMLWDLVNDNLLFVGSRILVPTGDGCQISAVRIFDDENLRRQWRLLARPFWVLSFPNDTSCLIAAAVPDADGVVRTISYDV